MLIIGFLIFIYNPHNIFTTLSLVPEEGYTSYLVPTLFLLIVNLKKNINVIFISILICSIYLTKGSMAYFCYSLAICLFFILKKKFNLFLSFLPLILIIIAYSFWGLFGYLKTNKIISPISTSTMSGSTLIVSSNSEFKDLYYLISPDPLEKKMWQKYKNEILDKDEFEINNFFVEKSKNYILNNKIDFLKTSLKKFHVIFTNFKKDAQPSIFSKDYNKIRYSNIANKFIFSISIFIAIYKIFKNYKKNEDIIFLVMVLSFIFPYLIGWAYTRHIVPLYVVSHYYLFIQVMRLRSKYFSNLS